jgi:hypothetical protein
VVICLQFSIIAALLYRLVKTQKLLKQPVPDETASDLMRDLLNGGAVAVVKVIDPKSIFLFSPRDRE